MRCLSSCEGAKTQRLGDYGIPGLSEKYPVPMVGFFPESSCLDSFPANMMVK